MIIDNAEKANRLPKPDPDEFISIFNLGVQAATGAITHPDPRNRSFNLEHEDGSIDKISLTNHPMNIMFEAIGQEYGADRNLYQSIIFRIMALLDATQYPDPLLDAHVIRKPEGGMISNTLIRAAAFADFNDELQFDRRSLQLELMRFSALED